MVFQVSREAWSAQLSIASQPSPGARHDHRATVAADQSSSTGVPVARPRTALSPRRPWLLGALLLAGAAQLITISALPGADPLAVIWCSLLLAIALRRWSIWLTPVMTCWWSGQAVVVCGPAWSAAG